MPRPVWSGTISFGLVSIPIKLFHGVSKKSVSFNQLDDRTMSRVRLKKVSADTGDEVPNDHLVKGYEVSKGRYVVVDPDELEPLLPSSTHSIDLEEFVDLTDIDPVYFDTPYIVVPDSTVKPYALLARAMESAGKVGIGRFVMRNKQYVAAVRAVDGTLRMSTMVLADEVVDPGQIDELAVLDGIEVSEREVQMAGSLVESLTATFDPGKYHDEYREQVMELIERKAAGEEFEPPVATAAGPKVIDLMAALEASVAAAKEARGRHPSTGAPSAAKRQEDSGSPPTKAKRVRKSA